MPLIYGESYEVTSTGENYYVPVIKGASKSYKELKEDIPDLPIVVPGDDIRLKFDDNGVAQRYYLEKTKTIDVFIAPPVGNGHCHLARGNHPKELEDYGYSKHFIGYIKDDLKVYARGELDSYSEGLRSSDDVLYATYRKATDEDGINVRYALLSVWSEAAWKSIGR